MGLIRRMLGIRSRHDLIRDDAVVFICPKCGKKKLIEDYEWKCDCAPEQLKKEIKCPVCGTKMVRKTLFK